MPKQDKNNQNYQCPRCGSEQYSIQHAGGGTSTFLLCKKCGYKAAPMAWQKRMEMGDSFEMAAFNMSKITKEAVFGIGGTDVLPSSQVPNPQKYKGKRTTEFGREEYLKEEDPEETRAPHKTKKVKNTEAKDMGFNFKKLSEKTVKPFNMKKIAREFRYTEEQIERKNIGKNMVFPEGKLTDGEGGSESGKGSGSDEARRFDTIDRKDMHSSPNPSDFQPGYKEWYEREVDKYYDGWLDDHIENSGGKVVGSNTEKMMNLEDDERYHAPEYPKEAVTEKLLESRHNFDEDYTRVVAEKGQGAALTQKAQTLTPQGIPAWQDPREVEGDIPAPGDEEKSVVKKK